VQFPAAHPNYRSTSSVVFGQSRPPNSYFIFPPRCRAQIDYPLWRQFSLVLQTPDESDDLRAGPEPLLALLSPLFSFPFETSGFSLTGRVAFFLRAVPLPQTFPASILSNELSLARYDVFLRSARLPQGAECSFSPPPPLGFRRYNTPRVSRHELCPQCTFLYSLSRFP